MKKLEGSYFHKFQRQNIKNLKFNLKKIVLHSKKIAPCVNSLFGTPKIFFSQDSIFFEWNRDINF